MKTRLLIIYLVLFAQLGFSQALNFLHHAGSTANDEALDICYGSNGNIYSTGYFSQTVFFDNITYAHEGNGDAFVASQDAQGNYNWVVKLGGIGADRGLTITCDASGNIYAAGTFTGLASLGSQQVTSHGGSQDVYVMKISPAGAVLWLKTFGGNDIENVTGIVCTSLSEVWLTGQFRGTSYFENDSLTSALQPSDQLPSYDIYLYKLDTFGNPLIVKSGGSKYNDRSVGLDIDIGNNVYLTGHYSDTLQFANSYPNTLQNAAFVMKFNFNGIDLWQKKLNAYFLDINDIDVKGSALLLAGDFKGHLLMEGSNALNLTSSYQYNVFALILDLAGGYTRAFQEGSANQFNLNAAHIDDNLGNIYFTGTFSCTQTEYSSLLGEGLFNSVGYQDIWLTSYSITGQRLWMRQYGGQFQDEVYSVHSNGGISPIIAGSYTQRFLVPANNTFVYTQANTDSIIQHPNSSHPYCNDSHYGEFISVSSFGNKDILVARPFDINRAVYDYYIREDSSCTFPIVPPQIVSTSDTISACEVAVINIQLGTGLNWQAGPIFNYSPSTSVDQTGMYQYTISQIDGCKTFTDSIYVVIHPSPSQTSIYSTYGTIKTAIPQMGCWEKLTKLYGDTAQLYGNLSSPQNNGAWSDPNGNYTSGTQVSAFDDGIYTFTETTSFGCSFSKCVRVISYTINSQGGIPSNPGDSAVAHVLDLLADLVMDDTINICEDENIILQLVDSITYYAPLMVPAFVYWEISPNATFSPSNEGGPYTFLDHTNKVKMEESGYLQVKLSMLLPPFNSDTILQVEREVYVNINPNPDFALSITSASNGICPGDTSTLLITAPHPYTLVGNFFSLSSDSSSCLAVQPGYFTLEANYIDPITGCGDHKFDSYHLKVKDAPIVTLNPSSGIKCPADSVTLIADAGNWVSWFGPQGNEIGNAQQINVNPPGNYYYILTDFSNCTLLSNTVEVKDLSSPEILTSPRSICNGNPAYVTLTSDPLIQYNWLPPLSGSDTLQLVYEPGIYMVEATFCNATNTFSIEVELTGLQAEIDFSTDSVLCTQRDLLLVANPGMVEYSWQNGAFQTPDYLASDSGWVFLSIKDPFGCISKDSLYLEEFTSPLPPDSLFTIPSCPGTIATAIAISNLPILWFDDLVQSSFASGDTLLYTNNSSDQFIYAATVDTTTSCTSSRIQTEWVLKSNVIFPFVIDSLNLCGGETINLNMSQVEGLESGSWVGPNGFTSSNLNASISNADSSMEGSYYFYPIGDELFCVVDTPQITVDIFMVPEPQIDFPESMCENQGFYVEPILQDNMTYHWTGPNGSFILNSYLSYDELHLNNTGNYTLTSTLEQCSREDQFHLSVVHGPKLNPPFILSSPTCVGNTIYVVNLNPASIAGMTVNWYNAQDFQTLNSDTLYLPNAQVSNTGDFSVQVEVNGCLSLMKVFHLVVQENPVSNLVDTYSFCEGDELTILGPPDMYEYNWSTGENTQQAHVTEEDTIVLEIVDSHGCSVIDSTFADAVYCDVDKTPNTFSPNDDGINDKLIFKVEGGIIHQAKIFDRQGRKIKTLSSPNIDWDGKNESGERVIPATYFYVLQVGMLNGELKSQEGTITVFE